MMFPESGRLQGNLRSILSMLLAVAFFSLMDAVMKTLAGSYPAMQVAAMRGLSAMPLVLVYVLWRRETGTLLRCRWSLHVLRGFLGIAMLFLFAWSLKHLGLAESYTIFFVAPLLITMLSIPLLKERVRLAHWVAIAVGMVGVVIALRPDQGAFFSLAGLAVLGAAGMYSVSAITGRILSRTDSSVSLVFWMTVFMSIGAGGLAWNGWVTIAPADWPLIVALAITGFLGQLAITDAFRHGQASAVAPFEYTALAWGIALDWGLWHTTPDAFTLGGGAIIIGSGLYLVHLERLQKKAKVLARAGAGVVL